jgi:NTP pyrophosphatase (non-canonical NTP hydrolase)
MESFDSYQSAARSTAVYPNSGSWGGLAYASLGLAGEAGEVANKVKKVLRDEDGKLSDERRAELADELGDVLWYVAAVAEELGAYLSDVAEVNVEKLRSRKERGVLKGSGDTR